MHIKLLFAFVCLRCISNRKILSPNFEFVGTQPVAGGPAAADFVLRLLAPQQQRMNCAEALEHPFLSS